MGTLTAYQKAYLGLPERLVEQYTDLNFYNHCYLRIALDNTIGAKWDTKIKRPAYKHLSKEQLDKALNLLRQYEKDKTVLLDITKFHWTIEKYGKTRIENLYYRSWYQRPYRGKDIGKKRLSAHDSRGR